MSFHPTAAVPSVHFYTPGKQPIWCIVAGWLEQGGEVKPMIIAEDRRSLVLAESCKTYGSFAGLHWSAPNYDATQSAAGHPMAPADMHPELAAHLQAQESPRPASAPANDSAPSPEMSEFAGTP